MIIRFAAVSVIFFSEDRYRPLFMYSHRIAGKPKVNQLANRAVCEKKQKVKNVTSQCRWLPYN